MLHLSSTKNEDIRHTTPSRFFDIRFLKSSGALDVPKGSSLLKQKRPYGTMEVVSGLESSASGICPNPLLASNLLKGFST